MKGMVFDAEANGLHPDKFHCLAYNDGTIRAVSSYEGMRKFLLSSNLLVGHNIQRWDIPNLERVLGISVKAKLIDTLAISWYLQPSRPKHGLESYGEEFGVKKPPIDDWENLQLQDYIHRCKRDVEINSILWEQQWKALMQIYDYDEKQVMRFLAYLSFKMDCAKEQEELGWRLDVGKVKEDLSGLLRERETKTEELSAAMPKVPIKKVRRRPAKPFKMDGSLSAIGKSWKDFCETHAVDFDYKGEVEYVDGYKEPNPGSHEQIKAWLYDLGWKPQTFLYKRDKATNELTKIPQVSQDKTLGPGLCKSVLKLVEKEPAILALNGLAILGHRISILEGFLKNVDTNGFLKAEVDGLTNTLRFKHRTIVNLPGVNTPYGECVRPSLISPSPDRVLCGSDMSGLEDRLKQHYIYPYDPEYVEEMNHEGFDPHLDLAVSAGGVSKEEAEEYKSSEHKNPRIKALRHTYKQGNYAAQYGASPNRLALTIGCTKAEAEKIHEAYWKRNWAIKAVADNVVTKVAAGSMWLYNPISKFWYSLRCEKDKFSTLVQGSAVFCFDSWVRNVRKHKVRICGQFHDEIIAPVKKENTEALAKVLKQSVEEVNEQLKLNRALDVDVQFGDNYGDIH